MPKDKEKKSPAWLKRIQEGSWEPEILISGIVLFGLFQIPAYLDQLNVYFENYSYALFSGGLNETLTSILKVSINWLIAGFVMHLFFRSIWAAFVGLSYVYPEGVKMDNLNYIKLYKKHLRKNIDYTSHIIRLEKICSSFFAISFLIFMWILGLSFALVVFIVFIATLYWIFPGILFVIGNSTDPFVFAIVIISLIDLITLGGLKRIPYFRKLYYPLYRLISWLTLSFLYRNIYYGFVSNHKKWKVSLLLLLYISITLTGSFVARKNQKPFLYNLTLAPSSDYKSVMNYTHYRNLAEGNYSDQIHIPSDIVEKQVLEVFVVHKASLEEFNILPVCDYERKIKEDSINKNKLKLDCLNQFYEIKLNDKEIVEDGYYTYNAKARQDGLKYYLDISDLNKGNHELSLYYNFYKEEGDSTYLSYQTTVEFYKVSPRVKQEILTLDLLDSLDNGASEADFIEIQSTNATEK